MHINRRGASSIKSVGIAVVAFLLSGSWSICRGLEPEPGALFVRVVDTGAGLCCVIKTDDDRYMVYDAGHWQAAGWRASDGVRQIVPSGQPITFMVLSHSDSDHLGGVKRICDAYEVQEVIRPGSYRDTNTWIATDQAIRNETQLSGCQDINLLHYQFPQGDYQYGATKVTFVCGWDQPPSDWDIANPSEQNNAGSICIRVEFAGKSILFCGDAVGRHLWSPEDACINTEKYMCDNATNIPIQSNVLIAPHHGANNGSSARFIQTVDPEWAIFSAGHAHQHPANATAQRFLDHGISITQMLRTDRGDDEPGQFEWKHGRISGHSDMPGDDDIDILIRSDGELVVAYRDTVVGPVPPFSFAPTDRRSVSLPRWNRHVPAWVLRAEAMSDEEAEVLDRPMRHPTPQLTQAPAVRRYAAFQCRRPTLHSLWPFRCFRRSR